jgi:VWFA-related protein
MNDSHLTQPRTRFEHPQLCALLALFALAHFLFAANTAHAQAGRRPLPTKERSVLLNVFATRADLKNTKPIDSSEISLYDDGIEQRIQSFTPDLTPARIVLLVDNSLTLRSDAAKLAEAAREFAYEIYEGDQLLTIAYDESAEIIHDWTDSAQTIEDSLKLFRKKGEPRLLDAFTEVVDQALRPFAGANRKLAVVILGDGLDRDSKKKFPALLAELQSLDITVYALQLPDRTGGALRRDTPKPAQVVRQLAEGTGGRVFPLAEGRAAASAICDELRKNRYVLAYTPTNPAYTDPHRLLIVGNTEGIDLRHKSQQPAR